MSIPVLYHGGLPHGTSLSDIDLFRVATKQKGCHGGDYAGFYLTDSMDVAERYNGFSDGGGVFEVKVKSNARVLDYESDVTRIKKDALKEYANDYDLIRGKNVLGKVEYVLLNKNAVGSFREIDNKGRNGSMKVARELVRLARMLMDDN